MTHTVYIHKKDIHAYIIYSHTQTHVTELDFMLGLYLPSLSSPHFLKDSNTGEANSCLQKLSPFKTGGQNPQELSPDSIARLNLCLSISQENSMSGTI